MKKITQLQFFLMALLFCMESYAQQLPLTSSSSNPVWYYIQVMGSDGREGLVFTDEETEVHGRAMLDGVNAPSTVSSQLWRFEDAGDGYFSIINKSSEKKIDVSYNASLSIGYATLSNNPSSKFKLVENTSTEGYYTIQSDVPASGGSSSEIYLHQANTGGSRDYIIMMVGTDYGFGLNSAFTFILYNDYTVEYSNDLHEIWYNIVSGKTGTDSLAVKDNSQAENTSHTLSIEKLQTKNLAQQWKVVKNEVTDKVNFINRLTKNYIQPRSIANGAYNIPQLGAAAEGDYTLAYLGQGQYTIAGVEEDAVTRFFHLSSSDAVPQEYEAKNAKDSDFAWLFKKISGDHTSINVQEKNILKINVVNGRIFVNIENYTVTTISGVPVQKSAVLPAGVYIVTANGTATKVLVK